MLSVLSPKAAPSPFLSLSAHPERMARRARSERMTLSGESLRTQMWAGDRRKGIRGQGVQDESVSWEDTGGRGEISKGANPFGF